MNQKKCAVVAIIIFLLGGVFSPLSFSLNLFTYQKASAQEDLPLGIINGNTIPSDPIGPTLENGTFDPNNNPSQPQSVDAVSIDNKVDGSNCNWEDFSCRLIMNISAIITFVPIHLAKISAMIFDYSIWSSLQSGTYSAYDGTVGDEGFVIRGWKLVRDFSNLIFIFALFFIAFVLILGLDNNPNGSPMGLDPKKTIARVIIMALLVNFSFFFGRSIIEVTNIFSLGFYNKMTAAPQMNSSGAQDPDVADIQSYYANNAGIRSIGTSILSLVNPQTYLLENQESLPPTFSNFPKIFFFSVVSAVFGLFLVYIFLSIALLFIGRTIGLFLMIIISPIAFVSYTVPFLQKQEYIGFDDWMKQFFGLAFMAPIFLFFLYICVQFFKIEMGGGAGTFAFIAQTGFRFALVGFLLIFAKKIAKDLSGKIGGMVSGVVTSVITTGAMVGAAVATGGASAGLAVARQSATRGLASAGNSVLGAERTEAIQQRLASTNFRSIGQTFKDLPSRVTRGAADLKNNPLGAIGDGLKSGAGMMANTTMNLARASGSQYPDRLQTALNQGAKLGSMDADKRKKLLERVNNTNQIKAVKEEKLKKVDKKISDARNKLKESTNPNDRDKLVKELSTLLKERKNIENPPQTKTNTRPNGQGNSGTGGQTPPNQPTPNPSQQSPINQTPPRTNTGNETITSPGQNQDLNVGTLKATNLVVGNSDAVAGKPTGPTIPNSESNPTPVQPTTPEPKNGYEQYPQDTENLAATFGNIAEAFRPKPELMNSQPSPSLPTNNPSMRATSLLGNIQNITTNFKDSAPEQISFDQSSIVPDSLPGNNGNFDFGGIQLPNQPDEE